MSAPAAVRAESEGATGGPARRRRLDAGSAQRLGLLVVIAVLVVAFGSARSAFFNQQLAIFPLLRDIAMLSVVGLAQLCGAVDRAHEPGRRPDGRVLGDVHRDLAYQDRGTARCTPGLVLGLVAGAAIGAFAGWIIAATGVNSFVVTLAMDFLLLGLVSAGLPH